MNIQLLEMYKAIADMLKVTGTEYSENQVNWEIFYEDKFYSRIILSYENNEAILIIKDEDYINECIILDNDNLIYSVIGYAYVNRIKILTHNSRHHLPK